MKVLLLDTAFAAAPIHDYLLREGHEVWVMGNRSQDLLAQRAGDYWIEQDYSDVEAVERHATDRGIERAVPGCTDVSIETCLALSCMQGHVDASETNLRLSRKRDFRQICEELDLPAPKRVRPEDLPMEGRFICKPVDGYSGRGITVFDGTDTGALRHALSTAGSASPSGSAIIETFVEGQLHSCSAFFENGRMVDRFYVLEGSSANPYAVDTSHVRHDMPPEACRHLEQSLERLVDALALKDGLLHTQFLLSDGAPYIVEVARRCPGDLYPLLIEYSTGFAHAARYASYFLGSPQPTRQSCRRHVLRHTITSMVDKVYDGLRLTRPLSVSAFYPLQTVGQKLLGRQGNRAGILFCEAVDAPALTDLYLTFLARDCYEV